MAVFFALELAWIWLRTDLEMAWIWPVASRPHCTYSLLNSARDTPETVRNLSTYLVVPLGSPAHGRSPRSMCASTIRTYHYYIVPSCPGARWFLCKTPQVPVSLPCSGVDRLGRLKSLNHPPQSTLGLLRSATPPRPAEAAWAPRSLYESLAPCGNAGNASSNVPSNFQPPSCPKVVPERSRHIHTAAVKAPVSSQLSLFRWGFCEVLGNAYGLC